MKKTVRQTFHRLLIATLWLGGIVPSARAQVPTTQPDRFAPPPDRFAPPPRPTSAPSATQPAAAASPTSPSTKESSPAITATSTDEQILQAMDRVGRELTSLVADVSLAESDELTGKDEQRSGEFRLRRLSDGDMQVRVNFTKLRTGRKIFAHRIEYLLAGEWLVDRNYPRSDDDRGSETLRQVRKPGERVDLFKLGQGPFPLPIGQSPASVRAQFAVERLADSPDRAGLVGVKLKPLPTNRMKEIAELSVWVGPDALPRVIETLDAGTAAVRTTRLENAKLNSPLTDADFQLEPVDPNKWSIVKEAYAE